MKHILFDMDGTLIESHRGILSSLQYTIDRLDIECLRGRDLMCFVGPPLKRSFMDNASMTSHEADEAVRVYREYYARNGLYDSRPYDGIEELLKSLYGEAELYVCTSKPVGFAKELSEHFHLAKYFRQIVGSDPDDGISGKDGLIGYIAESFGLNKSDMLMVGDKYQDVYAAQLCGIGSVGVTYGYGTLEELMAGNAGAVVNSVPELKEYLKKII